RILGAVINAEEKERARLSKELHDGLGPILSAIKLYVNQLKDESDENEKQELFGITTDIIDEAIENTRTISNNLRPRVIEEYGLVKAIKEFIRKINKTQKIGITFNSENIPEKLNKTLELIFYRIINELINNTIKHAGATHVDVFLEYRDERLVLTYHDDGVGFDEQEIFDHESQGMGLNNILSRIRSIDGDVSFESQPGQGMLFKAWVDLNTLS
ncbi:MAG: sensor histidine kinase, partial [Bacteroidetes bacterium]|nr:sensor histidine kinase [Bacteroidota bacterium]